MDADRMRDERLAELRRAVYARDAPPDAAAAYAAALAELARTTAVDGPPPDGAAAVPEAAPRHRRWAAIGAACGVAATLVLGTVLAARPEARPAAAPTALPTATTPTRIAPPPVPGPVLATFTSTSGAFGATLDAQGRHVFLAAECAGSGTVTIALSD